MDITIIGDSNWMSTVSQMKIEENTYYSRGFDLLLRTSFATEILQKWFCKIILFKRGDLERDSGITGF